MYHFVFRFEYLFRIYQMIINKRIDYNETIISISILMEKQNSM